MKEQEKTEIKRLSDRLDALNHREPLLLEVGDTAKLGELLREKDKLSDEVERLKGVRKQKLSEEAEKLQRFPFSRAITRKEQTDMGSLKRKVRGIIVVHPMTALGREMGVKEVTGFAKHVF